MSLKYICDKCDVQEEPMFFGMTFEPQIPVGWGCWNGKTYCRTCYDLGHAAFTFAVSR